MRNAAGQQSQPGHFLTVLKFLFQNSHTLFQPGNLGDIANRAAHINCATGGIIRYMQMIAEKTELSITMAEPVINDSLPFAFPGLLPKFFHQKIDFFTVIRVELLKQPCRPHGFNLIRRISRQTETGRT